MGRIAARGSAGRSVLRDRAAFAFFGAARTSNALVFFGARLTLVRKVLLEILKLLYKLAKVVFWKWVRPILGKVLFAVFGILALLGVLVAVAASAC